MENEIWKDIPNYEGLYQVSNLGRVKSLKRVALNGNNKFRTIKERILKQNISTTGYYKVKLSKNGQTKDHKVHKMICIAFLGHIQSGYNEVINHKDLNPLNNNINNLELTSQRENSNLKHIPHTSIYTGVHWNKDRKKWKAQIYLHGEHVFLGSYDDEEMAGFIYQEVLNKIKLYPEWNKSDLFKWLKEHPEIWEKYRVLILHEL